MLSLHVPSNFEAYEAFKPLLEDKTIPSDISEQIKKYVTSHTPSFETAMLDFQSASATLKKSAEVLQKTDQISRDTFERMQLLADRTNLDAGGFARREKANQLLRGQLQALEQKSSSSSVQQLSTTNKKSATQTQKQPSLPSLTWQSKVKQSSNRNGMQVAPSNSHQPPSSGTRKRKAETNLLNEGNPTQRPRPNPLENNQTNSSSANQGTSPQPRV